MQLAECETLNQFGSLKIESPQFTRGYGLVLLYGRAQVDLDGTG